MHCLFNYIGLKGCSSSPISGRFINELPSLNSDVLKTITNVNQVTVNEVFKNAQLIAWDRLITDLPDFMIKQYRLKSFKPVEFNHCPSEEEKQTSSVFFGWEIVPCNCESSFLGIAIQGIKFLASAAGDYKVVVLNKYKEKLFEQTVTATEGWNDIEFEGIIDTDYLFVGIDIETNSIKKLESINHGCDFFKLKSAVISNQLDSRFTCISDLPAIIPVVAQICDYSNIICKNKRQFLSAWMNLLGYTLLTMNNGKKSVSAYNTVLKEEMDELRDNYLGEYARSMSSVLGNIELVIDDICVECNAAVQRKVLLP